MQTLTPKHALVSLADKSQLDSLAKILNTHQITAISTGNTGSALTKLGVKVLPVSEVTGSPELLGGRVKTLHPAIHAGILARKDHKEDQADMKKENLLSIDLVVVNLYPFAETLAGGGSADEIIENIDIGGVSLIRAAAKNHRHVALVTSSSDYAALGKELDEHSGKLTEAFRLARVRDAFLLTADYDRQIAEYFATSQVDAEDVGASANASTDADAEDVEDSNDSAAGRANRLFAAYGRKTLRYGENPHQSGAFYADASSPKGLAAAKILQGKQISYNNYADAETAMALAYSFSESSCAIIKHAQPCGVAQADTPALAYRAAYAADSESAFGGVIAFNREVDREAAEAVCSQFAELVIAPAISPDAIKVFAAKKNLRLLVCERDKSGPGIRKINGGWLMQSPDDKQITAKDLQWVTPEPKDSQIVQDLLFAWTTVKLCRSNAIVIAKDCATCGLGVGQTSRVFSVKAAIMRATDNGRDIKGAVLASDGFFPFADSIEHIAAAGISAIIQPGGSKRDEEVIEAARGHGIAMALTGYRCFWHA